MSNTLESLKAAVEVHKMRDADLRRQGAEEFRARAIRRLQSVAASADTKIFCESMKIAAGYIAALPLEPELEGEKP